MKIAQSWWSVACEVFLALALTYTSWLFVDEVFYFVVIGLWLMTGLSVWFTIRTDRYVKELNDRLVTGHCLECGYNLKGVKSNCPECGLAFSFSRRSSPEAFRTKVAVLLKLASSPKAQREYQDRTPAADIQMQMFSQWEDIYDPDMPNFKTAFTESERIALGSYDQVCTSVSHRSKGLGLDEFHKLPECSTLADAADNALEALGQDVEDTN